MKFIDKITFLVFLLIWSAEIICQETKSVPPSDLTAILELFNGKKYYQALQNLEIIFRQGNKDHRVLLPLFNCYYYCEEYEKAAGFAESNTEVFSDMQNHLLYAHSLYYLGKLPEAEKAMEKAPRSDLYYQILFSIFETEDRWNNLKYEFHSCRGKLGNSTLQFWLGKITERTALQYNNYMKEQDFNRAAEALREIISLDSRDYYILSLAGLYYAIEDYENARLTAEKITFNKLQSDDEKFTFYKLNGMINCRLGEYEKAAAALTTARKIKCIDYDLEYYTALAYY
ncbi:MAG TPA: hypothetical protein DC049_18325, partial [Spirochaetia bacterium]|nr:hypothetical protein [Spirochaetia bacterium]